jgi:hypothetical protein
MRATRHDRAYQPDAPGGRDGEVDRRRAGVDLSRDRFAA